jgi:hypothetical protein
VQELPANAKAFRDVRTIIRLRYDAGEVLFKALERAQDRFRPSTKNILW